eukprot:272379-Chlamydomonas_euryale.AAC.3
MTLSLLPLCQGRCKEHMHAHMGALTQRPTPVSAPRSLCQRARRPPAEHRPPSNGRPWQPSSVASHPACVPSRAAGQGGRGGRGRGGVRKRQERGKGARRVPGGHVATPQAGAASQALHHAAVPSAWAAQMSNRDQCLNEHQLPNSPSTATAAVHPLG